MTKDLTTKIANTAQIIVASAACVADPTGVSAATMATTGALSLPEIFKRNTDANSALTKPIAKALKKSLNKPTFHMPANGKKLLPQMLDGARLSPDDLVDCELEPDKILGALLDRHVDPEHRSGEMAEAFCNWLRPPLTELLGDKDFIETLAPKIWATALGDLRHIREVTDRLEQQFRETAEELGITKGLVIGLARRIATDVSDFDTAIRELERALNVAANIEKRSLTHSNTNDLVDQVMRQMAELNEADDLDGAAQVADDALVKWREEQQLQQALGLRLLDVAKEQDILRRDAPMIAHRLVEQVQIGQPDSSQHFGLLLQIQDEWHVKGRDKGLALELEVSIELAKRCCDISRSSGERGAALNNLGNTLTTLGHRERGTERLKQAIKAHKDALRERKRDMVPLQWAGTQNNLGIALQILGERETGTERLHLAVKAYQSVLQELSQDKAPLDWAATHYNLGSTLQALGERESGTERLTLAIRAYQSALQEYKQDIVPLDWAATQCSLGTALCSLGRRGNETTMLELAVTAFQDALQEVTQDKFPLDWATAQNNLGGALKALGEHESGTERLEKAIIAFEAALQERTQNKVPLEWAITQNNLGSALQTLGERESGIETLEKAVNAYNNALQERVRDKVPLEWAVTQHNLGGALTVLYDKTKDTAYLNKAEAHVRAALEVFEESASFYAEVARAQLQQIAERRE